MAENGFGSIQPKPLLCMTPVVASLGEAQVQDVRGDSVPSEQFKRLLKQLERQYVHELASLRSENIMQWQGEMGLSSENMAMLGISPPKSGHLTSSAQGHESVVENFPPQEMTETTENTANNTIKSPSFVVSSQVAAIFTSAEPLPPPDEGSHVEMVVGPPKESKPLTPLQESSRRSTFEDEDEDEELVVNNGRGPEVKSTMQRCTAFLQSDTYELVIGIMIVVNSLVMAVEFEFSGYVVGHSLDYPRMQKSPEEVWPSGQNVFDTMNVTFTIIFLVDIVVRISVLRRHFFQQKFNWLDLAVVSCSVVEILFEELLPLDTVFIRLLRLGKVARAIRVVRQTEGMSSLIMLLRCVQASFNTLCWSLSFIVVLQCIAGMVISQVVSPYMTDETVSVEARRAVFRYYGTFTSTFLTMFEVLLANWAPAARILVDNVSDLFVYVFVVYRCVVGFAILNVVNAVFIQQTMRVAQADQELIIKQRIRAESAYASKMRQFFEKLDRHQSGFLTWKDFNAALQKPELRSWMATLDLETYDLVNLFHLIDDGDGQITVAEFLEGAIRLRGLAKSVDLAQVLNINRRLDAKMEALCMAVQDMSGKQKFDSFRSHAYNKNARQTTRRLDFCKREEEQEQEELASRIPAIFRKGKTGKTDENESNPGASNSLSEKAVTFSPS